MLCVSDCEVFVLLLPGVVSLDVAHWMDRVSLYFFVPKVQCTGVGIFRDKLIPCQSHGTNFYYARAQYNVSGLEVKPRTMSKDKRSSRIFKTIDN